jgi:hypothetical protein
MLGSFAYTLPLAIAAINLKQTTIKTSIIAFCPFSLMATAGFEYSLSLNYGYLKIF